MNKLYEKYFIENKFFKFNLVIANVYGLEVALLMQIISEKLLFSDFYIDNVKYVKLDPKDLNEHFQFFSVAKINKALKDMINENVLIEKDGFYTIKFETLENLANAENEIIVVKTVKEKKAKNYDVSLKEIANEMKEIYNNSCTKLPKLRAVTDKKLDSVKKFLEVYTLEDFKEICNIANKTDFLTGFNDRKWVANFDFLMRVDKAEAILEGRYQNIRSNNSSYDIVARKSIVSTGELQL